MSQISCARAQGQTTPVSYYQQIKPILQKRCQGCHQPASQGGKLILTTYEAFRAGGDNGAGFVPGNPDQSVVMRYITGNPPAMPKGGKPLSASEVALFRRWIVEGAKNDTPLVKDPIRPDSPPVYKDPPVISALAYAPNGETLAVSGYRETLIHSADGSRILARLVGRSPRIESLAYSPDGKLLAAVGGSPAKFGEVQFWDTGDYSLKTAVEESYDVLYGAAFSPDGHALSFGAADRSVRVVSVPDGKRLMKFDNHSDWVFSTVWATDNKHLLSTGRDRAVKLIVAADGSFVDDINTHTSPYRMMARHPQRDQVLVAGEDGIPRLYQVFRTKPRTMNQEDHNLLQTYEKQAGQMNAVAFSPDGNRFVIAGESGEARVYETATGKRMASLKTGGVVYALAYHPKEPLVAAGGFDGKVRIYNTTTGALIRQFSAVPISPGMRTGR
jgi:hypothetical protein